MVSIRTEVPLPIDGPMRVNQKGGKRRNRKVYLISDSTTSFTSVLGAIFPAYNERTVPRGCSPGKSSSCALWVSVQIYIQDIRSQARVGHGNISAAPTRLHCVLASSASTILPTRLVSRPMAYVLSFTCSSTYKHYGCLIALGTDAKVTEAV